MSAGGPGRLRLLLFRATLLGWPRSFRRTYGAELESTYEEAWTAEVSGRGRWAAGRFWARLLVDGAIRGPAMRLRLLLSGGETAVHGGVSRRTRERRMMESLRGLVHDGRQALRAVRREPGTAASVIGTLALGLGAATAIFTIVDALLLRPLPFAEPERLVQLHRAMPNGGILQWHDRSVVLPLLEQEELFADVAVHARMDAVLTSADEPMSVRLQAATASLFTTLGRGAWLGRTFDAEDAAGAEPVLVVSYEFWRTLGADRTLVGQTVELDAGVYRVVGVLPPEFRFPSTYAAHGFVPLDRSGRGPGLEEAPYNVVARLRDDVAFETAVERAVAFIGQLPAWGDRPGDPQLVALDTYGVTRETRRGLVLVAGAVGFMLLIALLNAANLLLARVTVREREFAIRHSVGASRWRLLRQLVAESALLAVLAGIAAVGLAVLGVRLMMPIAPVYLTDLAANRIAVDGRVLAFTFVATVLCGLMLGVLPGSAALRGARRRAGTSLSAYAAVTRERNRLRGMLVVVQVAAAVTLLSGAGLLGRSFVRLMNVETGFDTERLLFVHLMPNRRVYPDAESRRVFSQQLDEAFRSLPGVAAVGRADALPPSGNFRYAVKYQTDRDEVPREDSPPMLPFAYVSPEFIPALGARIIAGRNFTDDDVPSANVVIIDADMARWLFGRVDVAGRSFRTGPEAEWLTVVGVIEELMLGGPDGRIGDFALLHPTPRTTGSTAFAVRTAGDAGPLVPAVRGAIRRVDPNQPVWRLWTARQAIADEVARERFFATLMVVLAGVSLALSAVGLFSLLAFSVARRRRELGIRMAVGARAPVLVRLVLAQGMALAAAGLVLGLAGALYAGRFIESLLFEVRPDDALALGGVGALLLVVAALASAGPAVRVTRVDPLDVLRSE